MRLSPVADLYPTASKIKGMAGPVILKSKIAKTLTSKKSDK